MINKGKFEIDIHYSNFTTDCKDGTFKEGDQFISIDVSTHQAGYGSPCKSRKEAVESIRSYIFSKEHELEVKVKPKDVKLKDSTDLRITIQEIFKTTTLLDFN